MTFLRVARSIGAALLSLAGVYVTVDRVIWINHGDPVEQTLNGDLFPEFACPGEWIDIKRGPDNKTAEYRCGMFWPTRRGFVPRHILDARLRAAGLPDLASSHRQTP